MTSPENLSSLFGEVEQVAVERAIADLRAGRPVLVTSASDAAMIVGVESLDAAKSHELDRLAAGRGRLLLTAARLRHLGAERATAGMLALPTIDLARIETLALQREARIDAPAASLAATESAALELASLALVLPAVVAIPMQEQAAFTAALARVSIEAIHSFRTHKLEELRIVGRAPVPLEGAPETEFVVFRGGEGMRDQVAIVVGKPDLADTVPVRIHSACLTGDLFGSLKCDCGDQLRGTARWMAENGGGVILYLDQEGRGNGIANKMRAYKLQSEGFDTYEADEILGFEFDQRHFDFAAVMLKMLGIASISMLTNNPLKIAAMREADLDVVSHQRVIGRPTAENLRYLTSKRDRAGHFIDMDVVAACAATKD